MKWPVAVVWCTPSRGSVVTVWYLRVCGLIRRSCDCLTWLEALSHVSCLTFVRGLRGKKELSVGVLPSTILGSRSCRPSSAHVGVEWRLPLRRAAPSLSVPSGNGRCDAASPDVVLLAKALESLVVAHMNHQKQ